MNTPSLISITAPQLKTKLAHNKILLIDVREPAEYQSECINQACLIPLAEISAEKLPSTSRPIVIHCKMGKRSVIAGKKLLEQNPKLEICFLEGGIDAWKSSGFPVKKSGRNVLPLDQQTQLVAGTLAFSGTVLGAILHPAFYTMPGVVGAGLIFAGVTGWCGMAILLAKMPWNK